MFSSNTVFNSLIWQFPAPSAGGPTKRDRSRSADEKPAWCCYQKYHTDGYTHERGGHRCKGYRWWHWRLAGQNQAASRRGEDKTLPLLASISTLWWTPFDTRSTKSNILLLLKSSKIFIWKWNSKKMCLSSSASEQHARCDYLDVKGREAGSFCQSSSKWDPVHELQWTGTWQTLRADPDHLYAGAKLVKKNTFIYLRLFSSCLLLFLYLSLSVPNGQK